LNFYLDSNICIYFLKGIYPSIKEKILITNPSTIKIPFIVKAELLYGAEKSQQKAKYLGNIKLFLEPYEIVPFHDECSILYSKIHSTMELKGMIIDK
jgi:tRNA(fMet)-specific endonuclease VapC